MQSSQGRASRGFKYCSGSPLVPQIFFSSVCASEAVLGRPSGEVKVRNLQSIVSRPLSRLVRLVAYVLVASRLEVLLVRDGIYSVIVLFCVFLFVSDSRGLV